MTVSQLIAPEVASTIHRATTEIGVAIDQGTHIMPQSAGCVALTGASGFVGRHVLPCLLDAGFTVRVLARDPNRLHTSDSRITVVKGDLFNATALAELVDRTHAVIHLVGIIMQVRRKGQTFHRVHVAGTKNLIMAARSAHVVRWVHMSALGSRPNAISTYHRTKWQAEQALRQSGLTYTIFRPSIIHGPDGEFMQMIKQFACKRLLGVLPWMPYFGAGPLGTKGAGRLQPVWVQDVARYFVAALGNSKTENQIYPVGGPDTYAWPQLYATCKQLLPDARPLNQPKAVPVWYAKIIAGKPGVPFNRDQVIMSQEDSVCQTSKVQSDLQIKSAPFEETFAAYANQIGAHT